MDAEHCPTCRTEPTRTPNWHHAGFGEIKEGTPDRVDAVRLQDIGHARPVARVAEWRTKRGQKLISLIAAAPETASERDHLKKVNKHLLAALKLAEKHMVLNQWADEGFKLKAIRAAIARAEDK